MKKKKTTLLYPGLRYAHQKHTFGIFKNIWELYDKNFFKNENLSFFHQTVLLESKSHRNKFISFLTTFRNCMKIL